MTNDKKILIADDEKDTRELVGDMIGMDFSDYNIEFCENGNSLKNRLEKIVGKETEIKLVLTDNEMPGYQGSSLIREYARKINAPMILVYAGDNEIGEQAVKDGAFAYLKKPYRFSTLSEIVGRALNRGDGK
ncbi:MAG: response regulator [Nanoarchaeota archaeon]|nr:response regulator [Nanoarchaeota archaeon]